MEPPHVEGSSLPSTESRMRRYKPIWRFFLISNLALGGYIFAKSRKKNLTVEDKKAAKPGMQNGKVAVENSSTLNTSSSISDEPLVPVPPTVIGPVKVREPIPYDQQRELFKWMLEEKRKVKPRNPEEKKKIDEEKAILKQFIRAKSIPQLKVDESIFT